jgi:regulatory protein
MIDDSPSGKQRKRPPKPLDPTRLGNLALAYVARFSTSATKLERYLRRKVRERGWEGEGEPQIPALVGTYVELGYVDDEMYARAKTGGLMRRGYGARRVHQALGEAGIDESLREKVRPGVHLVVDIAQLDVCADQRRDLRFALALPASFAYFAPQVALDKALREKQIAAMLRAGHPLDSVREMVDAKSVAEAERWVAEAEDEME